MLLATSMAPPLCGEAAVSLAFVLAAMPDHLYIKSRSLSARYTPIRSRGFMIPSVFSQFPAPAYRHARHGAGQGWHQLQSHRWPKPREPLGWHCPMSLRVGCGEQGHPCTAQSQPWAWPSHTRGDLSRPSWSWAISEGKRSQPERILAWIWRCWGCPHRCTIRDAPCFPSCYVGRNIVWDPLLHLQAPHMSEITGKIKTWKTTIKRELSGKRNRMIWCLYEASVELQQARKEGLSGMSELYTFSHYTPNSCLWTHCYSISEIFALAVLVLVLSDTKPLSLLLQWNYFLS